MRVLPTSAVTGGVDWDLRFRKRYSLTGYWAGSDVQRSTPTAIDGIQENSRHYYQRPDLRRCDARRDPHVAGRQGGQHRASARSAASASASTRTSAFKSPGLRHQRRRLPAPRRSAQHAATGCRSGATRRTAGSAAGTSTSISGRTGTSDGDLLSSGRQRQRRRRPSLNNWSLGGGVGLQRAGFDDRATRGGPGVYTAGYREGWSWLNSDNRRALSLNNFTGGGRTADGASWFELSTRDHLPSDAVDHLTIRRSAMHRDIFDAQWVDQVTDTSNHYVFAPPRSDDGCLTQRFNYTMSADAVAAALRAAIRLGRRLRRIQGGRQRPQPRLYRALPRLLPTTGGQRRSRFQREVVPHDQRACAGSTSRARRCSWCGSRRARTTPFPAASASAATSAASSAWRRRTCSS